ncbi:hypothetical protein M514_07288 [Trichuris suis]|uniref:Uncharacterized protein n=1 Tax=Trichuris suis TaxID=68888 RepID=A0A085N412_9BILA|nr:hypothetical protein M513_07288 [Trichuris suis]KFD64208.1 hypothetical protein M514_07288 [Trichuris suis]
MISMDIKQQQSKENQDKKSNVSSLAISEQSAKERQAAEKEKQKRSGSNQSPNNQKVIQELLVNSTEAAKEELQKQADQRRKKNSSSSKDRIRCTTPVYQLEVEKNLEETISNKSAASTTDEIRQNLMAKTESQVAKNAILGNYFDDTDGGPLPGFDRALTRRAWDSVPIYWGALAQPKRPEQVKPVASVEPDGRKPKTPKAHKKKSIWRSISDPFRLLRARLTGNRTSKDSPAASSSDQDDH